MLKLQQFTMMLPRRAEPQSRVQVRNNTPMKNLLLLTASIVAVNAAVPAFGADLAPQPVQSNAPKLSVAPAICDWTGYYIWALTAAGARAITAGISQALLPKAAMVRPPALSVARLAIAGRCSMWSTR